MFRKGIKKYVCLSSHGEIFNTESGGRGSKVIDFLTDKRFLPMLPALGLAVKSIRIDVGVIIAYEGAAFYGSANVMGKGSLFSWQTS